jgi:hypothetical protein
MADVNTGDGPAHDLPSHVKGIKAGNSKGNYAKKRNPIDPSMPNLPPA